MLNRGTAAMFQDYADSVFGRYVSSQIAKASCVDVVWDVYLLGSLKATTRKKRGKGVCRRVETGKACSVMITTKQSYLHFLLSRLSVLLLKKARLFMQLQNKMFYARRVKHLGNVVPCLQEADARFILHAADAGM